MIRPVVNLDALEPVAHRHGEEFEARTAPVASRIGARKLGARLVELPPGRKAWPFHSHHVNEEMFVILEGDGELRYGDSVHRLRRGDVVACPPGGAESAHQIRNTSSATMRYLAISTMEDADIMEYPDSGKIGVFAGAAPGGDADARRVSMFVPRDAAVDYWEGES